MKSITFDLSDQSYERKITAFIRAHYGESLQVVPVKTEYTGQDRPADAAETDHGIPSESEEKAAAEPVCQSAPGTEEGKASETEESVSVPERQRTPEAHPDREIALITDRELTEREKEDLEQMYFPVLIMREGTELDPYQSGYDVVRAVLSGIAGAEKEREEKRIRQQMEDCEEKQPKWACEEEKEGPCAGKVILVYSPFGGIGVSTLAGELAVCRGEYGRTLMLDLSGPSPWKDWYETDPENGGLSDLLYSFLAEPESILEERIEQFIEPQKNGVFFLKPLSDPEDAWALTETEAGKFWEVLKSHFDCIVADCGKTWCLLSRVLLEKAEICCLLQDIGDDPAEVTARSRIEGRSGFHGETYVFLRNRQRKENGAGKNESAALKSRNEDHFFSLPDLNGVPEDLRSSRGSAFASLFGSRDSDETGDDPENAAVRYRESVREAVRRMG